MSMVPTLLSVENLSKSYGGVHAVRSVSFELRAGEILALIGPNGAGKSTCFDMLNGQNTPDSGRITLLGGVETVSGAVIGAIVFKAANIWLVSQTDLSKLVLGGFIVLMVVAFPKGIVGTLESVWNRRRSSEDKKSALATSRIEVAE
jgi:ABC-type cobalamin/Fe3+-siderophores transport system ATPase subunit